MGRDVAAASYTREQRQRYRDKVHQCLDVFEQMLATSSFDFDEPMTGMEIELNLVDAEYRPGSTSSSTWRRGRWPAAAPSNSNATSGPR
jgi:hypothetical protein